MLGSEDSVSCFVSSSFSIHGIDDYSLVGCFFLSFFSIMTIYSDYISQKVLITVTEYDQNFLFVSLFLLLTICYPFLVVLAR